MNSKSLTLDTCIEGRVLGKRAAGRVSHERQECQRHPVALKPISLVFLARSNNGAEVHFDRLKHVWAGRLRSDHVRSSTFSHPVERYESFAQRTYVRCRSCTLHASKDVATANPSIATAADDLRGIERMVSQESAD